MKQYIGIARDHSGSMAGITTAAMRDYNSNIDAIRKAAIELGVDTIVSTVKFGMRGNPIVRETVNSSIVALNPITVYEAQGGTPLFDAVLELIDIFKNLPDKDDPEVSFLIMVITDGGENESRDPRLNIGGWGSTASTRGKALAKILAPYVATDRWTFTFRVPRGYASTLASYGIASGNIMEWDQTQKGLETATAATQQAVRSFYTNRTKGITSSQTFYADLSNVKPEDLKRNLTEINNEVNIWDVNVDTRIDDFIAGRHGSYSPDGKSFYQLTKREKAVQDYKKIVLRDRNSGKVFGGDAARKMLGLPDYGTVTLAPGDHKNYEIFISSTSLNRKLPAGTKALYWHNA